MNKYDSLLVEGRFVQRGYETTAELDEADVVLFNTCSVREHAEERTFSWLGGRPVQCAAAHAPLVQWIEHRPPKPGIEVRIL